jgi:serine protease Do
MIMSLALLAALPSSDAHLDAAFERVDPSVVTVRVAIRRIEGTQDHVRIEAGIGTGSGVVLHPAGFIATAAHVVEEAESIELELKDGTKTPAHVVTLSRTEDIALLKAESAPPNLVAAPLADSDKLKVGQLVFAIGTPANYPHTMSTGIVSSIRNEAPKGLVPGRVIQTDAALNPGSSGGPLFNERGEVVGIASYIYSKSGGSEGLGFAIPSNTVRRRLFEKPLPYLGVSLRILPQPIMQVFNWPYPGAMLVERVRPESAAANAGLKAGVVDAVVGDSQVRLGGDLIIKVGPYDAWKTEEIGAWLAGLKAGDPVVYRVLREGQSVEVSVPVPEREAIPKLGAVAAPKR